MARLGVDAPACVFTNAFHSFGSLLDDRGAVENMSDRPRDLFVETRRHGQTDISLFAGGTVDAFALVLLQASHLEELFAEDLKRGSHSADLVTPAFVGNIDLEIPSGQAAHAILQTLDRSCDGQARGKREARRNGYNEEHERQGQPLRG